MSGRKTKKALIALKNDRQRGRKRERERDCVLLI
jgi:hypothetical protein